MNQITSIKEYLGILTQSHRTNLYILQSKAEEEEVGLFKWKCRGTGSYPQQDL